MLTVKSEIRDLITGHAGRRRRLHHQAVHAPQAPLDGAAGCWTRRGTPAPGFLTTENEDVRFQNLLFDAVTELPTVPVIIDALRDRLLDNRDLGVLFVDVEQYSHIEETYGWEVFDGAAARHRRRPCAACSGPSSRRRTSSPSTARAARTSTSSRACETGDEALTRLQRKARQVEESLRGSLDEAFGTRIHKRIGVFVGHAAAPLESADARRAARLSRAPPRDRGRDDEGGGAADRPARELPRDPADARHPHRLPADLPPRQHRRLRPRGADARPRRHRLREPRAALPVRGRARVDLGARAALPELLRVALRRARTGAVSSSTWRPTRSRRSRARDRRPSLRCSAGCTRSSSRSPERSAIRDVPVFRSALARLRELGFRIAIDDAGSGYASLQAIAELRPDFIKVANTLITGLRTGLDQARRRRDARQPLAAASTRSASRRESRRRRTSRSAAAWGSRTARASTSASPPRRRRAPRRASWRGGSGPAKS